MSVLIPLYFYALQLLHYCLIAGAWVAVNTCPKGREPTQAVLGTGQMWELGQPACLFTLCKTAPCLHFFPLMPPLIHL